MPLPPIIAPSLLAADPGKFQAEISSAVEGGGDWLHLDVMDGSFVPPITFGDNVVRMAKRSCKLFLDVHLMVYHPETHLEEMRKAGADQITIHQEVSPLLRKVLENIRSLGSKAGVAINPGTPAETVFDVLEVADTVLVMTVKPGWGGQPFIPSTVEKMKLLSAEIQKRKLSTRIEVDGGITVDTAKICKAAGASIFVAGSSIFGSSDRKAAIKALREA